MGEEEEYFQSPLRVAISNMPTMTGNESLEFFGLTTENNHYLSSLS